MTDVFGFDFVYPTTVELHAKYMSIYRIYRIYRIYFD